MGPIIIFDKSTLQSLSVDEAVWLHRFYTANVTPLLYVETLADLEKTVRKGRTPEEVVGNLALKTLSMGGRANVHHYSLCRAELLGAHFDMRHIPVISGGRPVPTANGSGVFFRPSPEEEAFQRWQRGEFLSLERTFARAWRRALANLDLSAFRTPPYGIPLPKTLAEARVLATAMLNRYGWRYHYLKMALVAFDILDEQRAQVLRRWREAGGPALLTFAPFVAHVITVDLFLDLALQAGLISSQRPSNRVDIAYLYYLPFCMLFVSNDRLHENTVPLFIGADQVFCRGVDLKADLAKLDTHYSTLPEDVREQGVMRFAAYPPLGGGFLATEHWDRLMSPRWRQDAEGTDAQVSPRLQEALLELVKKFSSESPPSTEPNAGQSSVDVASADAVVFESRVPLRMGKWRILPPGVERSSSPDDKELK